MTTKDNDDGLEIKFTKTYDDNYKADFTLVEVYIDKDLSPDQCKSLSALIKEYLQIDRLKILQ